MKKMMMMKKLKKKREVKPERRSGQMDR